MNFSVSVELKTPDGVPSFAGLENVDVDRNGA